MYDVRNDDGRLVCRIDESLGAIEICIKGCITLIYLTPGGKPQIINTRKIA